MNTVSLVNNYTYLYYNFGQGPLPLSVFASAMSELAAAHASIADLQAQLGAARAELALRA